jgi:hypothetical protein
MRGELGKIYPSPSLLIGERETVRSSPLAGGRASLGRSPLQREKDIPHRFVMDHAYWGPQFSNRQLGTVLGGRKNELDNGVVEWRSSPMRRLYAGVPREPLQMAR